MVDFLLEGAGRQSLFVLKRGVTETHKYLFFFVPKMGYCRLGVFLLDFPSHRWRLTAVSHRDLAMEAVS